MRHEVVMAMLCSLTPLFPPRPPTPGVGVPEEGVTEAESPCSLKPGLLSLRAVGTGARWFLVVAVLCTLGLSAASLASVRWMPGVVTPSL